ncbi:MAG TPA: CDP-diacylglycerol--glycerol-3-phosphate 3-phosphatidyltransferase [Spirochaetota bacterium]|nr:CDP-diacylglycerol--glycerol-3-phosphate 3-phosphatidyltransferase [Spirochaetota bacterium]
MSNIIHIANLLTTLRVVIVPFFICAVFGMSVFSKATALILFGLAALSDYFDGYFARKHNRQSKFGEFLDPLADKLIVGGAFISFALLPDLLVPLWLIAIILSRELFVTRMRVAAIRKNRPITTEVSGKVKTAVQMSTIIVILVLLLLKRILIAKEMSLMLQRGPDVWVELFGATAGLFLYCIPPVLTAVSALLALVSMAQYIGKNWAFLTRKKS